jgi:hypothetical protein
MHMVKLLRCLQVIDDDDIGLVSSSSGGDGEFFNLK